MSRDESDDEYSQNDKTDLNQTSSTSVVHDPDAAKATLVSRLEQIALALPPKLLPPTALQQQHLLAPNIVLRPYQTDGVAWLLWLHKNGLSGILADEMGLGKTIQAIAFVSLLHHTSKQNQAVPALVVVPLSILDAWIDEFRKFTPGLSVQRLYGTPQERNDQMKEIRSATGPANAAGIKSLHAVVTTYETAVSETDFLNSLKWSLLVVDEAHRLKNPKSLLHQRLYSINCEHRLLMTGTPVQNNIAELQALLSFANPDVFDPDQCDLEAWFAHSKPQNHTMSSMDELTRLLRPLILRRIKEDVADLPPIKEVMVHAPLSSIQRKLYLSILSKDWSVFDTKRPTALRNMLIQLRKCVAHPYIFDGVEPEPFVSGEHLVTSSGKLMVLDRLLERAYAQGKRVLIFSQMTHMLDIVQDYLTMRRYSYERLDGSVRGEERYLAINGFQGSGKDGQPGSFVFLLSTRAGGVGLNLTAADMAVFLDMDFNPAMDAQAAARLHRIGQTKPTTLVRIVCPHTVDDVIWRRARRKLSLQNEIMNKGVLRIGSDSNADTEDDTVSVHSGDTNWTPKTSNELIAMLHFGLDKIVEAENANIKSSSNQDFDQVSSDIILSDSDLDAIFDPNVKTAGVQDDDSLANTVSGSADLASADDSKNDSIYVYCGQDYRAAADALERLRREQEESGLLVNKDGSSSGRKRRFNDEDDQEYAQRVAERLEQMEQRRHQRRMEKWAAHGYVSYALDEDGMVESSVASTATDVNQPPANNNAVSSLDSVESIALDNDNSDEPNRLRLRFATGDASQPRIPAGETAIIVHVVDDSGSWPNLGFFRSLASSCPDIPQYYTTSGSKPIKNLELGSVHLVPSSTQASSSSSGTPNSNLYVALIVAQRASSRDRFDMNALTTCFDRVSRAAQRMHASVQMPRLGQNLPLVDWYAVERTIDKAFPRQGVQTTIYYFKRSTR